MFVNTPVVSRRRLLSASFLLAVFVLGTVGQINVPTGTAQSTGGFNGAIFDILPDNITPASIPTAPGGTFSIQGRIFAAGAISKATCTLRGGFPVLGTWRAWGTVAPDGDLLISQSYFLEAFGGEIASSGASGITLANAGLRPVSDGGVTAIIGPDEVTPVSGGSSTFRSAVGELRITPYCSDPPRGVFRYDRAFCMQIIEARRR